MLGWLATAFTLGSLWLLGSREPYLRVSGFCLNAAAAVLWSLWALGQPGDPWPFLVTNAVILVIDLRGALKTGPS